MATTEKPVMVIGLDESDHSYYALEWTLDHFFAPFAPNFPYKLIILHAKASTASIVGLAGPGKKFDHIIFSFFARICFYFGSITCYAWVILNSKH